MRKDKSVPGKRPYCWLCVHGKEQTMNYLESKAKIITYGEFKKRNKAIAESFCIPCTRIGIEGKTGWALSKLSGFSQRTKFGFSFKVVDNFELIDCPRCNHPLIGNDLHFTCPKCLWDSDSKEYH